VTKRAGKPVKGSKQKRKSGEKNPKTHRRKNREKIREERCGPQKSKYTVGRGRPRHKREKALRTRKKEGLGEKKSRTDATLELLSTTIVSGKKGELGGGGGSLNKRTRERPGHPRKNAGREKLESLSRHQREVILIEKAEETTQEKTEYGQTGKAETNSVRSPAKQETATQSKFSGRDSRVPV